MGKRFSQIASSLTLHLSSPLSGLNENLAKECDAYFCMDICTLIAAWFGDSQRRGDDVRLNRSSREFLRTSVCKSCWFKNDTGFR